MNIIKMTSEIKQLTKEINIKDKKSMKETVKVMVKLYNILKKYGNENLFPQIIEGIAKKL